MSALALWSYRWPIMVGCVLLVIAMMRALRRFDAKDRDRVRREQVTLTERRREWISSEAARSDPPLFTKPHVDARRGWRELDEAWKAHGAAHGATDADRAAMRRSYHAHPSHEEGE